MRVVLSALIVLLVAGLLWSLFAEREGDLRDTPPEATRGDEGAAPTLAGSHEAPPRRGPPKAPSDEPGASGKAPDTLTQELEARPPVTVTVLDYEGQPVAGALVMLRPRGANFASRETSLFGTATFPDVNPAKPCDLWIQSNAFGALRNHHEPDWLPRDTTIELERGLTITGRLVDEDGEAASDFHVAYRTAGGQQDIDVPTTEDGSFAIRGLPAGTVSLTAVYNAYKRPYRTLDPPVSAGPLRVEAGSRDVVFKVARGGVIHARIEDLLVDERIGTLSAKLHDLESDDQRVGEVDLDGNVIFLRLRRGGSYRLTSYGLGRSRYVDVAPLHPSAGVQKIQHKPGGRIRGRYRVPSGVTLRSHSVVAYHATLGGAFGRVLPRSTDFLIEGLSPETEWTVRVAGYAPTGRPGESRYFAAEGRVRTGEELPLTLVESLPPPR